MLFFITKMTMYWLKIIGLAPFSVPIKISARTYSHHSNIQAFQYSKIGLAYNILFLIPTLIALVVTFCVFHLYSENDSPKLYTCKNIVVIRVAETGVAILSACIVIISWGWKQEEGASIMNRLFEVDVKLSIIKHQPFNKRGLILITVHVIINITFFIIFWIRRILYFSMRDVIFDFFTRIPNYITHWYIIEYFIILDFLAQYFQMVNKYLLNLNEFGNYPSRSPLGDGFLVPVISLLGNRNSQLSSLRLLLSVRTKLYELCTPISQFFSMPILFCISCCFVPLVSELLGAIMAFVYINNNIARVANAFYVILMIIFYAYPIMSLASNVTRTRKEAELTGQIVHKLLSTRPIRKEIQSELTEFSLQLLHEDVIFTACGLFTLDATMLIRILGMTASYFFSLGRIESANDCTSSNNTTS